MKKIVNVICLILLCGALIGCGKKEDQGIVIYTSAEDYRVEYLTQRLNEEFPDYDITIEYMSTGNHAAKLLAEGTKTECDISYDLEYGYLEQLDRKGYLADLSDYDMSIYTEDTAVSNDYIIEIRNSGAVIINMELLKEKGLTEPTSYVDLLNPEYKGLVSMPDPKASGTGYMFLKSLVNAWGEEEAFAYFENLTPNILQYTSSGSGPINALLQGEAVIGLGMTGQAAVQIGEGADFKILYFEEGSPYSLYGQAIIKGKENRQCVKEVFDFLINTYNKENNEKFFPEQIYRDYIPTVENYPENIKYSDMGNNTIEEKERLLERWAH